MINLFAPADRDNFSRNILYTLVQYLKRAVKCFPYVLQVYTTTMYYKYIRCTQYRCVQQLVSHEYKIIHLKYSLAKRFQSMLHPIFLFCGSCDVHIKAPFFSGNSCFQSLRPINIYYYIMGYMGAAPHLYLFRVSFFVFRFLFFDYD